jgi:hypothetical protein
MYMVLFLLIYFETGSLCVAQASLEHPPVFSLPSAGNTDVRHHTLSVYGFRSWPCHSLAVCP